MIEKETIKPVLLERDTTQGTGLNNYGRNRYQNNSLDTQTLSFFGQNRFFIGDFTVTPGIRIEHYVQDNINHIDDKSEEITRTEALPGIGATYNGIDNVTLFAGVHRGFAPARIDNVMDPESGVLRQVNPKMSLNYEAGVRTSPIPGIGYNLSDKKYIASRIDGIHPGMGFQMMGGVKWTF